MYYTTYLPNPALSWDGVYKNLRVTFQHGYICRPVREFENACHESFINLPIYGFIENVSVGCILGGKCVAAILHAEHHKGFGAVVAHATASVGSHADYGAFLNREDIAVNLELSFPCEEEVELLMILVRVEKAGFLTGSEYLE